MKVEFTSAARRQLLEAVAAIRSQDRARARALVNSVEDRLGAVAAYEEPINEMKLEVEQQMDDGGYRLIYRVRNDVVWVVAVFEPCLGMLGL